MYVVYFVGKCIELRDDIFWTTVPISAVSPRCGQEVPEGGCKRRLLSEQCVWIFRQVNSICICMQWSVNINSIRPAIEVGSLDDPVVLVGKGKTYSVTVQALELNFQERPSQKSNYFLPPHCFLKVLRYCKRNPHIKTELSTDHPVISISFK